MVQPGWAFSGPVSEFLAGMTHMTVGDTTARG